MLIKRIDVTAVFEFLDKPQLDNVRRPRLCT